MYRPVHFVLAAAAMFAGVAFTFAQIPPPGPPFDASKHPNPIVTFVETKDFKPIARDQVLEKTGLEMLGLSKDEGQREALEIADGRYVKNMSILGVRTDVTFYPVIRQTFTITDGGRMTLYSFKFPRLGLPKDAMEAVLTEAALEKKKKPSEMRFGGQNPEKLEIRGSDAMLFEDNGRTTVYWQEDGIGHAATSEIPRDRLFELIEDLL